MRLPTRKNLLLLTLLAAVAQPLPAADNFGRFFTTPSQRQRLDELRKVEPEQRVQLTEEVLVIEEVEEEAEQLPVNSLTVQGLVYRGKGKSTAWINNNNTFEGGLSSEYIDVGRIDADKVELKIPGDRKDVKLSVGETFDPISESYRDIVNARISAGKSQANPGK